MKATVDVESNQGPICHVSKSSIEEYTEPKTLAFFRCRSLRSMTFCRVPEKHVGMGKCMFYYLPGCNREGVSRIPRGERECVPSSVKINPQRTGIRYTPKCRTNHHGSSFQ